jgi:hypothetical protein
MQTVKEPVSPCEKCTCKDAEQCKTCELFSLYQEKLAKYERIGRRW